MKILIIKLSSLGDILDTFAALTDAGRVYPDVEFDWVVEEAFAEVPAWHKLVKKIIPIGLRNFRKNLCNGQLWRAIKNIRKEKYDFIIDAQGLLKSGVVSCIARGEKIGLDYPSLTEKIARIFYHQVVSVDLKQHAVFRMRSILAQALDYALPAAPPDFGLVSSESERKESQPPYLIFLHGTTWATRHLPDLSWQALAKLALAAGYQVYLPWSNERELQRVQSIKNQLPQVTILPKINLTEIKNIIQQARVVIAIDTGLAHLSAMLGIPTVVIYGPTDPKRIGAIGAHVNDDIPIFDCLACDKKYCYYAKSAEAACLKSLQTSEIWQKARQLAEY
jgi:heptosyltransferase I